VRVTPGDTITGGYTNMQSVEFIVKIKFLLVVISNKCLDKRAAPQNLKVGGVNALECGGGSIQVKH